MLLAAAVISLTLVSNAHAWWNGEWKIRKKITIDTTASGLPVSEAVTNVAVLVRLHDGDFRFSAAKDDGSDIRCIAADDKTPLTFHLEKFDGLMAEAFVWVKVPELKPGAQTSFWLYYGNSSGKAERQEDAKGTYDAETVLVYHFNEHAAPAVDSSAGGNTAANPGTAVDGSMIGTGVRFEGTAAINIPASPSLLTTDGGAMTWAAWIKPTSLAPNTVIYSRHDGANALLVGCDNGVPFVEITSAAGAQRTSAAAPIAVSSWHHVAFTAAGNDLTLYVDGELYGRAGAAVPTLNAAATLGADAQGSSAPGFNGEIDELQISRASRSAGWVKLASAMQGGQQASKALTIGADEVRSSWFSGLTGGTMGVILGSLTVDGWIVIGILMIMLAISWWVMWSKNRYLNAVQRGNAEFLEQWSHLAADLTALDHGDMEEMKSLGGRVDAEGDEMQDAPVYRIYHAGAEEIRRRMAGSPKNATKILGARSIQAIRATLDAVLVRETQKLNKLMVLLTIAISGGPFLGLLGTVVGVMITFAAIAAAGDVNVNAIAPGIAAALAATVAGLAVAIPSLFGYNYLLSRVKNVTSDMHVFIDEFVTKMAEFYGGERENSRPSPDARLVG